MSLLAVPLDLGGVHVHFKEGVSIYIMLNASLFSVTQSRSSPQRANISQGRRCLRKGARHQFFNQPALFPVHFFLSWHLMSRFSNDHTTRHNYGTGKETNMNESRLY